MGIELLLVGKSFKVRLNGQRNNRGRTVSKVLLLGLGVYTGSHLCFFNVLVAMTTVMEQ